MPDEASSTGSPPGATVWPELSRRARAALDWLVRSERPEGGSAAYYVPLLGWSAPYPETTGYIVPTLYDGARRFSDDRYERAAERMARWLLTLQDPEGWFPTGTWRPGRSLEPSVFNTAQIVFGLLAAFRETRDDRFARASARAVSWLQGELDESGRWTRWSYREGHVPSYYAHVCWPMAEHWREFGGVELCSDIRRALDAILRERRDDGTFAHWAFEPGRPAFTHTIGYTLQGLYEAGRILGTTGQHVEAAADSLARLMRIYEIRKRLAGAYHDGWEPVGSFICLTGHAQIASAWLHLFQDEGDPRFLNAGLRALQEVAEHQKLGGSAGRRGAVAGSVPFWGAYMRGRYPNWAAKFFVDGLLRAEKLLAVNPSAERRSRDG